MKGEIKLKFDAREAVKQLSEVYAIQAEIEGMKVLNLYRESLGQTIAYDEESFCEKAEELRNINTIEKKENTK